MPNYEEYRKELLTIIEHKIKELWDTRKYKECLKLVNELLFLEPTNRIAQQYKKDIMNKVKNMLIESKSKKELENKIEEEVLTARKNKDYIRCRHYTTLLIKTFPKNQNGQYYDGLLDEDAIKQQINKWAGEYGGGGGLADLIFG